MKNKILNIGFEREGGVNNLPGIDLQYAVSREQAWENLSLRIEEPQVTRVSVSISPIYRMAIAASLLLLVGVAGFMRFYTKTVTTIAGQHLALALPDNSSVELNAKSSVDYHPYWFRFSRTVTLNGEAFFKVMKGNRFKVESQRGETTVLGTSFNIYSRDEDYNVTCFTGKVRVVSSGKGESFLLNPNEQAFINKDGFLRFVEHSNPKAAKSWIDNMFVFTGASIVTVLQEIERQYNIKIDFKADPKLTYTGNFSKSMSEKEVLDLVCTSLGLAFEVRSGREFLVN